MAKYGKVQFIAFNIRPGYKDDKMKKCWSCGCTNFKPFPPPHDWVCKTCCTSTGNKCLGDHKSYLGDNDHTKDIEFRCRLMKKAITTAYLDANVLKAKVRRSSWNVFSKKEPVLKVFMAPEFYFRGAEGAYPFEQIHTIMENLRKEIDFKSYQDWLFVFGTAIGYLKQEDTSVKITSVERIPGNKTKITVDSLLESDWTSASASEYVQFQDCSDKSKAPKSGPVAVTNHTKGVQATIEDIRNTAGNDFEITLDTNELYPKDNIVFFYREDISRTVEFNIKASRSSPKGTIITINNPDQQRINPCPACKCQSFEASESKPYLCKHCTHTHSKISKNFIRKNQYAKMENSLVLNTNKGFDVGHFVKLTAKEGKTEIGNYALVCKGGPKQEDTDEPQQFVIYKEYISGIDFLRDKEKYWGTSTNRRIEIHGQDDRIVIPTEGSRDQLSAKRNVPGTKTTYIDKDGKKKEHRISEINKVGYGGGSVFSIDDITFGLEICLDHAYDRIWEFYNDHTDQTGNAVSKQAQPGDPKVQIHLIPSWGMSIAGGKISCVDKGLVFNVDGPKGSEVRIMGKNNDYRCRCTNTDHNKNNNKPGNCVDCNEPLQPIGTKVKSDGKEKSVTDKDIKKYFEGEGKIVVYEKKPLPKGQTV
ncbi:MAG: hypothetical protein FJ110_00675 [Deltaproteobacteria bacterium]|nr:hypothetical protein [Deltaproteobacteria bacterium]